MAKKKKQPTQGTGIVVEEILEPESTYEEPKLPLEMRALAGELLRQIAAKHGATLPLFNPDKTYLADDTIINILNEITEVLQNDHLWNEKEVRLFIRTHKEP